MSWDVLKTIMRMGPSQERAVIVWNKLLKEDTGIYSGSKIKSPCVGSYIWKFRKIRGPLREPCLDCLGVGQAEKFWTNSDL